MESGYLERSWKQVKWDKDEQIEQKIKDSLEYVDNNVSVKPTYLATYKVLVQETAKKQKQKYARETLTFLLILTVILFAEVFAFTNSFTVFIITQALAGLAIPLFLIVLRFIKVRREETT